LVEHLTFNQGVGGSIPPRLTIQSKRTDDEGLDSGWGREDFSAVSHEVEKRIGRRPSAR
jgi:hypothetical protein